MEITEQKNLGGRPPNPKIKLEPKEYDLIKWSAERHQIKDVGEYIRRIILSHCKNYYVEQKKIQEDKKRQKEIEKCINFLTQ